MVVFIIFAGLLFYVRNRLKDEPVIEVIDPPSRGSIDVDTENSLSGLKEELSTRMDELKSKMKDMLKK